MTFEWKDYIRIAEDLLNRGDEAYFRSSISRAYYGTFGPARNKKGYKEYAGADVHWKVINEYNNQSEQDIGRTLDKLRRARNDADYNEEKLIKKDLAERTILIAKKVLTSIENL